MTDDLEKRVADLEAAVLELTASRELEFVGDLPGHSFRGNQYTKGISEDHAADARTDALLKGAKGYKGTTAPASGSDFDRVQRTEAAAKVGLKSFDHAEPGDPKLPTKEELKGGGATTFVRSFGYPEPGKGHGLWAMQHDASGTRLEGTGTRTAVQNAIKSQYPASGTWSILP